MTVCQQCPRTQREGPTIVIERRGLGNLRVWLHHGCLLTLLVLAGDLPVACLNAFFFHGQRTVNIMQFKVESTSIAHRFTICIPPPQSGGACVAVGTKCPCSLTHNQSFFWPDQRSVLAIHLVVQSAGVAQVVACAITSPQRGGSGPTVHAFSGLWCGYSKLAAHFW